MSNAAPETTPASATSPDPFTAEQTPGDTTASAGIVLGVNASRVPYLDQYVGLWLMREENFWAKYDFVRSMNISLHLDRVQNERTAAVAADRRQTAGGYGYAVSEDGIAVIELRGSLMKQETSADSSTSTVAVRRDVRAVMNDPEVRAIMFVHDSPGGTVAGAYELADDIFALAQKKPTASFVDGLSASADYLLAAMTGSISAYRTSEIGSIGTRTVVVDSSMRAAQMGVKVYSIDSGGMKSAGQPGTEITKEQLAYFQGRINEMQQHFVEAVSRGRRMSVDQTKQLADGRIHSAANAASNRLIDHVESYEQSLARLRAAIKTPGASMQPATMPRNRSAAAVTLTVGDHSMRYEADTAEQALAMAGINRTTVTANEPDRVTAGGDAPSAPAAGSAAGTEKEQRMADSTTTAPAGSNPAATENKGPKPATIAELKAAFASDPAFALEAAEKAFTLVEAKAAYADVLSERNKELAKENGELKTKAAAATPTAAAPRKPGVPPIESAGKRSTSAAGAGAGADGGDPIAAFDEAVTEQMKRPGFENRKKAVVAVCKKDPELHQAYQIATNPGRKAQELIADKFANAN